MSLPKRLLNAESMQRWCENLDITLVDVGASGGIQNRWRQLEGHLRVVGVEPDRDAYQELVAKIPPESRDVYLNIGLYDHAATLTAYVTQQQFCSSIYQPDIERLKTFKDWERFSVVREVEMQVGRLDVALQANGLADIDVIKVDTQGSELDILKGTGNYLTNGNVGIEVEVEFIPLYKGQPVFADVDNFLREQGYELFDLARHFWRRPVAAGAKGSYRGQLVFADALYFASPDLFSTTVAQYKDEQERTRKFIRAISVVLTYGYYDYALLLCDQASAVNPEATHIVKKLIHAHLNQQFSFPEIRGKTRLAMILGKVSEYIWQSRLNYDDRTLGN